jgi:hypothetical protein
VTVSPLVPPAPAQVPVPTAGPEEQRRAAEEVLARQEFQRPEPSLIERATDWLDRQVGDAIDSVSAGGTGSVVGWLLVGLAVAVIVWLIVRNRRVLQSDPRIGATVRIDAGRAPGAWRERAARLEAEGRWKEALRCHYRALLGDLVRRGVIVDVAGRTAGEYRAEVARARPAANADFAAATDLFERAWYADEPTAASENGRFRAHARGALAAVDATDGRVSRPVAGVGR